MHVHTAQNTHLYIIYLYKIIINNTRTGLLSYKNKPPNRRRYIGTSVYIHFIIYFIIRHRHHASVYIGELPKKQSKQSASNILFLYIVYRAIHGERVKLPGDVCAPQKWRKKFFYPYILNNNGRILIFALFCSNESFFHWNVRLNRLCAHE